MWVLVGVFKMPRNVWERLQSQIDEQNYVKPSAKPSVRFGKVLPWILVIVVASCAIGLVIGYFLS